MTTPQSHAVPETAPAQRTPESHTASEVPSAQRTAESHTVPGTASAQRTAESHTVLGTASAQRTAESHTVPGTASAQRTAESHTVLGNPPAEYALEDVRLPVRAKLAAAWTSFMFLYIYVDYLALYKPGFLNELLAGRVHEFDTGPTFVSMGLTLMAIPIFMIVLSATLPARVNRTVNLVVATLYLPVTVYNVAGEPWSYAYFYGLSIGLEVLLLAFILRSAWTWPRRTAS